MRERSSGSHLFSSACSALLCGIGGGLRDLRLLGCSDVWSVKRLLLWANECFILLSEVEALHHFGWKHLFAECLLPGGAGCYKAGKMQVLVSMTQKGIVPSSSPP